MRVAGVLTEGCAALAIGFALTLSLSAVAVAGADSTGQAIGATGDSTTSTAEIPPAQPIAPPPQTTVDAPPDPSQGTEGAGEGESNHEGATNGEIQAYEAGENPASIPAPKLHTLQEFMAEANDTSPIGVELREDRRKLSSGEQADGLLIVKVDKDSPAAHAGLHGYSTVGHSVLEGAAVAAAMVFPPAVLAIAVIEGTHVGESYDLIIGVDGKRVTNYLDFEDEMRDAKPGDVVYLSVVRNGKRVQVPVHLPATPTTTAKAAN